MFEKKYFKKFIVRNTMVVCSYYYVSAIYVEEKRLSIIQYLVTTPKENLKALLN